MKPLSVRASVGGVVLLCSLYVLLAAAVFGLLIAPEARADRDRAERLTAEFQRLGEAEEQMAMAIEELRDALAGPEVPTDLDRFETSVLQALPITQGLEGIGPAMRVPLAVAASTELEVREHVARAARNLRLGNAASTSHHLVTADSTMLRYATALRTALDAGLDDLVSRESARLSRSNQIARLAFVIALIGAVLSVGTFTILNRKLYAPMARLDKALDSVAAGHLDVELTQSSDDEMGRLARHFNGMTVALRTQRERLTSERDSVTEELARSREYFQQLLEPTSDIILVVDRDGLVSFTTSAVATVLGVDPHAMTGKPAATLVHPEDREAFDVHLRGVAGREAVRPYVRFLTANGGVRHFDLRSRDLCDNEAVNGYVTHARDVTEAVAREDSLRQHQRLKVVGELTGGLAHDFNNLLTIIGGNLDLVSEDAITDDVAELVDHARTAVGRGADLIAKLLSFSRKQPLQPQAVDLNAVVAEMDNILRRTISENISIEVVRAGGLWSCTADVVQVQNALLNLCVNARDAMRDGGTLTIETANAFLDGDYVANVEGLDRGQYVMLCVSDTGHGMDEETRNRAFDPFFSTKPTGRGTGLGLAMVHGFIKQSGGHVQIYSEPGEGTSVKLYFPRSRDALPAALTSPAERRAVPAGNGEVVLVLEDQSAVRRTVVGMLTDLGYQAIAAKDEKEFWTRFEQHSVDLLLSDIVLSGSTKGSELAAAAVARRPELRVLFMSGYTANAVVHDGRLDPGIDLLSKPFGKARLARRVRAALDRDGAT